MLLPDVNVWLAMTFDSHVHHTAAKSWFDALSGQLCVFCRSTQQGFLRLVTNASVFGPSALTLTEAWQKYDVLQRVHRRMLASARQHIVPTFSMSTIRVPELRV